MNDINVISQEIEVSWDDRKLAVITWIPFGENPNERPRVSVFEYFWANDQDVIAIQHLSHTWDDTREKCPVTPEEFKEARWYAVEKAIDDMREESW